MQQFESRRDRLRQALAAEGIDALLVNHAVNIRYLTGFTGDASYLIVGSKSDLLVSDSRFTQQIAEECPGLDCRIRPFGETTIQTLTTAVEQLGVRKIGIESTRMTVAELEKLREKVPAADWKPTNGLVERLRAVKDAAEVASIREAIAVAERVYEQFCVDLRPHDSELELADRVEYLVRRLGGRGTSFDPIVAIGERSALAHAPPTGRIVDSGDWLLLDWGAIVSGYHSDLTRILVPNKPHTQSAKPPGGADGRLAAVYGVVLAARDAAVEALRPGVKACDIDAAARKVFADAGMADAFSHSVGHGIGLETHERPGLRSTSEEVLEAGMVLTIEPGAYFVGWGGIRIEDDLLITPDGAEVLSALPRSFESIFV